MLCLTLRLNWTSRQNAKREGFHFTYDMWRKAIMSNTGVKVLRGLQFGMLDEDNDGLVSLADITRSVFRRAGRRDMRRIRRFLEVSDFEQKTTQIRRFLVLRLRKRRRDKDRHQPLPPEASSLTQRQNLKAVGYVRKLRGHASTLLAALPTEGASGCY